MVRRRNSGYICRAGSLPGSSGTADGCGGATSGCLPIKRNSWAYFEKCCSAAQSSASRLPAVAVWGEQVPRWHASSPSTDCRANMSSTTSVGTTRIEQSRHRGRGDSRRGSSHRLCPEQNRSLRRRARSRRPSWAAKIRSGVMPRPCAYQYRGRRRGQARNFARCPNV
jgi:hypothetical protein